MTSKITNITCYLAAFNLLDQIYQQTQSDDLGSILGDMSLIDGQPADSAYAEYWAEALKKAQTDLNSADLKLK